MRFYSGSLLLYSVTMKCADLMVQELINCTAGITLEMNLKTSQASVSSFECKVTCKFFNNEITVRLSLSGFFTNTTLYTPLTNSLKPASHVYSALCSVSVSSQKLQGTIPKLNKDLQLCFGWIDPHNVFWVLDIHTSVILTQSVTNK